MTPSARVIRSVRESPACSAMPKATDASSCAARSSLMCCKALGRVPHVEGGEPADEFVPAVTDDQVVGADVGPEGVGDPAQELVSGYVAVQVVPHLEIVDVHEGEHERVARPPCPGDFVLQLEHPGVAAVRPGEPVDRRDSCRSLAETMRSSREAARSALAWKTVVGRGVSGPGGPAPALASVPGIDPAQCRIADPGPRSRAPWRGGIPCRRTGVAGVRSGRRGRWPGRRGPRPGRYGAQKGPPPPTSPDGRRPARTPPAAPAPRSS